MASEDVIELGSSDDEAEPAPKKIKSASNAMVCFPNKGKVLNPALPPLQKVLAGGAVTITNVKSMKRAIQINKPGLNGRPVQRVPQKILQKVPQKILQKVPVVNPITFASKPIPIQNTKQHLHHAQNSISINPLNFLKNQQNIRDQVPKVKLPPDIIVTRTATGKRRLQAPYLLKNRQYIGVKPLAEKIITTVEIDDEAPITSGTSPQWYLRPEEQTEQSMTEVPQESNHKQDSVIDADSSLEVVNNKEPVRNEFEQITIEDSPVKPVKLKIAQELAITIEDSPIKILEEPSKASGSDNEKQDMKTPNSKKKLEYPKTDKDEIIPHTQDNVENDLEQQKQTHETKDMHNAHSQESIEIIVPGIPQVGEKSREVEKACESSSASEFNPVYQKFIDLCFELENSEDMKKIVEKKIKVYYRQCPKAYVESEEFTDMVTSKIYAMKADPDKMYLYIKDIVDELNLLRKTAKAAEISSKEYKGSGSNDGSIAVENEYDNKRRRQIYKLDKAIKKIHRAIQKLEEQEVEFDDEEDSVYLLTERYKERLIKVHAKYCQLTNTKMPSEARIQIEVVPGQPAGPARRLEKWVNRKVPIGKPLPFPDFHDVLRCVREANEEDKLGWNEAVVMEEARHLFMRCGRKLQRRRQENEWRIAASRISHDMSPVDPAEKSEVLKKKLEENKSVAAKKEIEVLNKYADKQHQLKLEAEEIGDKEADESPVESEEDEVIDDSNSLENKQKRKERLKRLLHEKTRKMSMDDEHMSIKDVKDDGENIKDKAEEKSLKEEDKHKTGEKPSTLVSDKIEDNITIVKDNDIDLIGPNISIAQTAFNNDCKQKKNNYYDTHDVDSDIDELHLLQKLYSGNEMNSSAESDTDSPIAISDTLDSDSETEKAKKLSSLDIISIENSSYSESEVTKDECIKEIDYECVKNKVIDSSLPVNIDKELSSSSKSKVDEYDENMLLASSDEETDNIRKINKNEVICDSRTLNENNTIDDGIIKETIDNSKENSENCKVITVNEVISHNSNTDVLMTCDDSDNTDQIAQDQLENESNFECNEPVSIAIVLEDEQLNATPETIGSTNDADNYIVNCKENYIHKNENASEYNVSNCKVDNNTETEGNNLNNDQLSNVIITEIMSLHCTDNLQTNQFLQEDSILDQPSNNADITSKEEETKEHLIENIKMLEVESSNSSIIKLIREDADNNT